MSIFMDNRKIQIRPFNKSNILTVNKWIWEWIQGLINLIFKIVISKSLEDSFLILCAYTLLPLSFHHLKKTQNEVLFLLVTQVFFVFFVRHICLSTSGLKEDHNYYWIKAKSVL